MKRMKLLILFGYIFLFGITSVNAMTLKPSGASSGKRGDEITLYIILNRSSSEKTVSGVDGVLSYDSSVLELVSSSNLMDGWTQFSGISNGSSFSYGNLTFDKLITSTNQNVAKMVFKINNNAKYGNTTVSVNNPSATDENADSVSIFGGIHNVKVLSDINALSNLTISNGTINFNENTTEYNLTIDDDSTNISATKRDSSSSISGDIGNKTLNYGMNTFKITVTSESGKSKVYIININRPDNRSKINTLSSLKLSNGTINFNKDTTSYSVTVENNISSIKVDASLTDNKSSFVPGYAPRTVNLNVGNNSIEIKVKAENEVVKTYTIKIARKDVDKPVNGDSTNNDSLKEEKKSNNTNLSELKISEGILVFDKEQTEYKVTVSYDIESIELEVKTEHDKATYEIDTPKELVVGENKITIKVKAEDNSEKEYVIIVIRKNEEEVISNNSKLKKLNVSGYVIDFNSNVYEYNLKIKNEKSLNIYYVQDDDSSNVSIKGNNNLQDKSVIEIVVVAEDGSQTVYKINIEKNNNNLLLIILLGSLLIIVLIIIIILTLKKKNKKNDVVDNKNLVNIDNDIAVKANVVPQNMIYSQPTNTVNVPSDYSSQSMSNVQSTVNPQIVPNQQIPVNSQPMQNIQSNYVGQNIQNVQNTANIINNQNNNF